MIMKKTYKITLPKGANISTVETNESNGVLEVTVDMKQKFVPKDGDIVSRNKVVAVYAGTNEAGDIITYIAFNGSYVDTKMSDGWGYTSDYRLATEAEKQRLFDALAKNGKRWNAEKKCIEDLPRWRAGCNKTYLYISSQCNIVGEIECNASIDNYRYNIGNYFRTREAAEKVAEQIRDIFKNSKAE